MFHSVPASNSRSTPHYLRPPPYGLFPSGPPSNIGKPRAASNPERQATSESPFRARRPDSSTRSTINEIRLHHLGPPPSNLGKPTSCAQARLQLAVHHQRDPPPSLRPSTRPGYRSKPASSAHCSHQTHTLSKNKTAASAHLRTADLPLTWKDTYQYTTRRYLLTSCDARDLSIDLLLPLLSFLKISNFFKNISSIQRHEEASPPF
ncbi:unnamed protein product [Linum trigynum]|uniref:Uncharacterized protein n=1 Tax=Linum trigynum TaxID=586398 RepID=A0AAV2DZX1_9ROSI